MSDVGNEKSWGKNRIYLIWFKGKLDVKYNFDDVVIELVKNKMIDSSEVFIVDGYEHALGFGEPEHCKYLNIFCVDKKSLWKRAYELAKKGKL